MPRELRVRFVNTFLMRLSNPAEDFIRKLWLSKLISAPPKVMCLLRKGLSDFVQNISVVSGWKFKIAGSYAESQQKNILNNTQQPI
jgi:hypothetical protein